MADLGNISKIQLVNGDVAHFQDLVSGYTSNTGTITGIKMNGSSKGTSGVVDLGTVITAHQDISGKADKSATVSTVTWDSTNNKLTKTINGTTTDVVTIATIKSALALPDPMVFKGSLGTGGTITDLPTAAASNKGYTYKVITAGTYASQAAKVGDTFISDGSAWVLIPSGDEPSGTVTSVGVSNGGGLSVSGSPITSSGTITISHADTSSQASSSNSGRTYIQSITLDTYGHVTGLSTATETVTDTKNTAGTTNKTNTKMYLAAATEQNSNPQTYSNANVYIGTDNCLYSNGAKVLTSHQDISGKIDTAGTGLSKSGTTLNHSNSITAQTTQAVYPIKIDAQGHISAYGSAVTIGAAAAKGVTDNSSATAVTSTDTNLITGRTLYYAGYTKNTGTITGVTAGTGLSGGGTSGSVTLNHSNSVTAGTASEGGSSRTLAFGGTFNIPSVSYDAQGHITGKGSITLTMPANPDTDTKTSSSNSSSKLYLVGATSQSSSGQTTYSNSGLYGTAGVLTAANCKLTTATSEDLYTSIINLGWSDVFA